MKVLYGFADAVVWLLLKMALIMWIKVIERIWNSRSDLSVPRCQWLKRARAVVSASLSPPQQTILPPQRWMIDMEHQKYFSTSDHTRGWYYNCLHDQPSMCHSETIWFLIWEQPCKQAMRFCLIMRYDMIASRNSRQPWIIQSRLIKLSIGLRLSRTKV